MGFTAVVAGYSAGVMTIAPFLYQTRTICQARSLSGKAFSANTTMVRRCWQLSSRSASSAAYLRSRPQSAGYSSFTVRRVGTDSGDDPREDTAPSTESVFRGTKSQYTRQQGPRKTPRSGGQFSRLNPGENDITAFRRVGMQVEVEPEHDLDFGSNLDTFMEGQIFKDDGPDLTEAEQPPSPISKESTITISEKHAFDQIFKDILTRNTLQPERSDGEYNTESNDRPQRPSRGGQQHQVLHSIMDDAMNEGKGHRGLSFQGQTFSQAQEKMREAVDRYPAALRAGAAKAIGLIAGRAAPSAEERSSTASDELESLREPERERVEGLLRSASTDMELWQVLESEVFPMIHRLGLDEKSSTKPEASKKRTKRKKQALSAADEESSSEVDLNKAEPQEEAQLDLAVHGPLYPSYLLLALRLLDREFTKPSPLVLNVLPRIKSLGIISHVLGASTAFYNELLRIHWYRYDDFGGISQLLTEMDQAGLDFDADTLSIVKEINRMQFRINSEDGDKAIKQLWSMPEYKSGTFQEWQAMIETTLDERAMALAQDLTWKS
ncbi:MAG: hypothetical protein M1818_000617 [Claussenomyces sp. TS43310]|nr:MAG: hypothetical protein M1818_000617 [Claussenomyces sp. TS43310]